MRHQSCYGSSFLLDYNRIVPPKTWTFIHHIGFSAYISFLSERKKCSRFRGVAVSSGRVLSNHGINLLFPHVGATQKVVVLDNKRSILRWTVGLVLISSFHPLLAHGINSRVSLLSRRLLLERCWRVGDVIASGLGHFGRSHLELSAR